MKRNISQFAIMAFLFSSLAFAGDKTKSTAASDDAPPATAVRSDNAPGNNSPCVSSSDKKDKNDKNKTQPAPSDQEEQFNKVLMGIYG